MAQMIEAAKGEIWNITLKQNLQKSSSKEIISPK